MTSPDYVIDANGVGSTNLYDSLGRVAANSSTRGATVLHYSGILLE